MQQNILKNFEKIYSEFSKLNKWTKKMILLGMHISLAIFALGTFLVVFNRVVLHYDSYFEFVATSVVRSSFTILAEIIIGCLLVDYVFNKS